MLKSSFHIFCFVVFFTSSATTQATIEKPFGFETLYTEGSSLSHFEEPSLLVSFFPANIYGNETSGFSFGSRLKSSESQTLSYEVKFSDDFYFVKGGKLPGICGGKNASGGNRATGKNGFSARLMWRADGRLVSYVYHVNQEDQYGDDFQWLDAQQKPIFIKRGQWHSIKITVGVNSLKQKNGFMKGSFNGLPAFSKTDFVFRTIDKIKADRLCFNTFFGGDDSSWAPKKQEKLWIRNLEVLDNF